MSGIAVLIGGLLIGAAFLLPAFAVVWVLGQVMPGMRVLPEWFHRRPLGWVVWSIDNSGASAAVQIGTPWSWRLAAELAAWWTEPDGVDVIHVVLREGQRP